MRRVWHKRWFDAAAALGREMRIGTRSLRRAKGLAATVMVTLALGIGANAAIFSVVLGRLVVARLRDAGRDVRVLSRRSHEPGE